MPTTTPVAFVTGRRLYLERMNVLSEDGAGILCEEPVAIGARMPLAFRLSTAKETIRCLAEVLATIPTTPAGLELKARLGDKAIPAIMNAGVSDSATAIFRMSDLPRRSPQKTPSASAAPREMAAGFSVRFVEVSPSAREAIRHHIRTSQQLADRLARQGGRSVAEDRPSIADAFDDGDLSARARDW